MSVVKCFLVEKTNDVDVKLRRYIGSSACTIAGQSYHNKSVSAGIVANGVVWKELEGTRYWSLDDDVEAQFKARTDWPTHCECGFEFPEDTVKQVFTELIYQRVDNPAERWSKRDLPGGAMYWNDWLPDNFYWDNHQGPCLIVTLPNGIEWNIDSRCNNCTLPNDRTHRCWVRTGAPPNITAGKSGATCAAGAGSILAGNYHGFLIDGELRPC